MTAQGLRKLGSGAGSSGGNKTPGVAAPLGATLATGHPIGLVVVTGMKGYGEVSGSSRIEGRVEKVSKEIPGTRVDQGRSGPRPAPSLPVRIPADPPGRRR
jgi:hypothetical protein